MKHLPGKVVTYLQKHSLKNYNLEWNSSGGIKNIVVIPAIAEYENIPKIINSLIKNDDRHFQQTLIIFVINNLKSSNDNVKLNNRKSLKLLRSIIHRRSEDKFVKNVINSKLNFGIVDAASEGKELDEKTGGVGLSRKAGMDAALAVFDYEEPGKNILFCTDADAHLSPNYLSEVIQRFNKNNMNAGYTNFEHDITGNDKNTAAIICYEIFLRYYVGGLQYAKSPYAFHTIGSTIICDSDAYIKIGGMNKKKAAEDFYFLEKLAKNYRIENIDSVIVYPSKRSSWRVPFGTGQRVTRYLNGKRNEYLLYNPEVFEKLKSWLQLFSGSSDDNIKELLKNSKDIHPGIYNFLTGQGFQKQWENIIDNSKTAEQLARQKKFWFDGFRTLKLIHHLRDNAFPEINMFDALDKFFNMTDTDFILNRNRNDIPSLDLQRKYLHKLRELEKNNFKHRLQIIR